MRVDVDGLEAVMRAAGEAERALGDVPRLVFEEVDKATKNERASHPYTNRTGNAEASTQCRRTTDGASAQMGVQYAAVLNARGWSEFDVWMDAADYEIRKAIDDATEKF